MAKVFIDGSAGTTGLRIHSRLASRADIELITLPDELRKDSAARQDAMRSADIVFLCLPDAAAIEAVSLLGEQKNAVVIDTSTAHRTSEGWTYGFPEICGLRGAIPASRRIANPGCHASGFLSLVAPLVTAGVLAHDERLTCFSLTGYSGGGKKMIADYEDSALAPSLAAPRTYGLSQQHKHLPEMTQIASLTCAPVFSPIVSSYYAGMEVVIPLFASQLRGGIEAARQVFRACYASGLVRYAEDCDESGFLSAAAFAGRDDMEISIFGEGDRVTLVSRFDNLGKGASGAAIQNMNLVLGLDEATGLVTA